MAKDFKHGLTGKFSGKTGEGSEKFREERTSFETHLWPTIENLRNTSGFVAIRPTSQEQNEGILGGIGYTSGEISQSGGSQLNTKKIIFSVNSAGILIAKQFQNKDQTHGSVLFEDFDKAEEGLNKWVGSIAPGFEKRVAPKMPYKSNVP